LSYFTLEKGLYNALLASSSCLRITYKHDTMQSEIVGCYYTYFELIYMKGWKLFWDFGAVIVGLFFFWQVFTFSGRTIPAFGYFPIGIVLGIMALGIGALLTHGIEGILGAILFKALGIRTDKKLLFE
jgi:hypothetical protein